MRRPPLRLAGVALLLLLDIWSTHASAQAPYCPPAAATTPEDTTLQTSVTCVATGPIADLALDHIRSVAGSGVGGWSGDWGPATAALVSLPHGVAVDRAGHLYIADSGNGSIRRVDASTGVITTIGGLGLLGFGGDGGPATQALLNDPRRVALDAAGHVFVADRNNARVRRIDAVTGVITTVAGGGAAGLAEGLAATDAELISITGLAFDAAGDLFLTEAGRSRVRRVSRGLDDRITGAAGELITTVAGTTSGFSGDAGAASNAQLSTPEDVAFDTDGNLYIADPQNHRIRRVSPGADGVIGGSADEIITTVAGGGGMDGDGIPAVTATLNLPRGVTVDRFGHVYISEAGALRVRRVDGATGLVSTVAGGGTQSGEDILATSLQLGNPRGLATDIDGNLFVAEQGRHRIRAVRRVPPVLMYEMVDMPANGTADLSADGTLTYVPHPDFSGTDLIGFRASNGAGEAGDAATVTITVTPVNDPPIADAGTDQISGPATLVQLDGSRSSDPDGGTLTYVWRFASVPAGSGASLLNRETAIPTFVVDVTGSYVVELVVTDGAGATATDTVVISATTIPVVTIGATDASAGESGSEPGTFTIARTGGTTASVRVNYTVAGTAAATAPALDYYLTPGGGSVLLAAGQTSATVTVVAIDDAGVEEPETVILTLVESPDYDLGAAVSATVTIASDDVLPMLTITATDAAAAEQGADPGAFTITRTGPTTRALWVGVGIGGTASPGGPNDPEGPDYVRTQYLVPAETLALIPAGQASVTLPVTPRDDGVIEGSETVTMTLLIESGISGSAYALGTPVSATITIVDNDFAPVVTIAATDAQASEQGVDYGVFTITRTGDIARAVTIRYTVGGTATPDLDYGLSPNVAMGVRMAAGQATAEVRVFPANDASVEAPETVVLTLVDQADYDLGAQVSATVTLVSDDVIPLVTIAATDPDAGERPRNSGTFTISREGPPTGSLQVFVSLGGTAALVSDYTLSVPRLTTLLIPDGQTTATVNVLPRDDLLVESSETVVLTLLERPEYLLSASRSATVTIASDDDIPVVTIGATDASAGESGSEPGTFTITRTGGTTASVRVNYTVAGTAAATAPALDYYLTPGGGSVLLAAGHTSATVTVVPIDDAGVEEPETVVLTLVESPDYDLGAAVSATVTIASDDVLPMLTITATDAAAAEQGADPGAFTITRTGPTTRALWVGVGIGGTASPGGPNDPEGPDYVRTQYLVPAETLALIPAGQASVTLPVTPRDDGVIEGSETVTMTLLIESGISGSAYALGTPVSATITIVDNDFAPVVTIAATDAQASEQGVDYGVFTITRTGDIARAVTLRYTVGGTATPDLDYGLSPNVAMGVTKHDDAKTHVGSDLHRSHPVWSCPS